MDKGYLPSTLSCSVEPDVHKGNLKLDMFLIFAHKTSHSALSLQVLL